MTKVLIVEDEPPISNLIRLSLTKNGYACKCVFDGMEAADFLEKERMDLILLDVMLPKLDGFELMEYIRPLNIPVIFLTAKNAVDDRVKGLRMGAEDYIVKPFEIAELLARVEVVLRRYGRSEDLIQMDELRIDVRSMRVERNGIEMCIRDRHIIITSLQKLKDFFVCLMIKIVEDKQNILNKLICQIKLSICIIFFRNLFIPKYVTI